MAEWENEMLRKNQAEETGIDDNGKKVMTYGINKPQWISHTKLRMPSGKIVSIDPNEQSYEAYNPNKFNVIMQNTHPNPDERFQLPIILIGADNFALIPHRYYTPWIGKIGQSSTEKFTIIENYGNDMFVGNKKPSAPTFSKIQK